MPPTASIDAEQFGVQFSGQVRQLLRVAVCRRQHLQDQLVHVCHNPHPRVLV